MNEEYSIYYRNSFHKMWSRLSNAYFNMVEQESVTTEAIRKNRDKSGVYTIVARYNSDIERKANLVSMIDDLRNDIETLESLLQNYSSDNAVDIRLEIDRMKSILRRRENELKRLEISISHLAESFDELSDAPVISKRNPSGMLRNLSRRISAVASVF